MSKAVSVTPPKHIAEFMRDIGMIPVADLMELPAKDRFDHAALGSKMELAGVLYTGFALMGLKEEVGHGNYLAELGLRQIEAKQAQRAVNLAQLSTRLDEPNWTTLSFLPHTKLLIVARFDDAELSEFLSGGCVRGITLEDVQSQPVRDIERRMRLESDPIREARQKAESLARRLDKTNAELERYRQQEIQLGKLPPSVRRARVEGGGMAMTFNEMFSHLTELANDVLQGSDLHSDHRKRQQQLTLAIDSLAIVSRGVAAQAALLLEHLQEKAPGVVSETEEELPIMDRAEALAAYHRFRSMLANADYSLDTALLKGAQRKRK